MPSLSRFSLKEKCAFVAPLRFLPSRPKFVHSSVTCKLESVILIPDHFSQTTPPWYHNLQSHLPNISLTLLQMPNPYESNSKRWESVWLSTIRSAVHGKEPVSLLAHGTGADACLRFLEDNTVDGGVVLVAPTGDEYFAGERHGRAYHWQLIRDNARGRIALATSILVPEIENDKLTTCLQPAFVHSIPEMKGRYAAECDASKMVEFVRKVGNLENL